MNPISRIAYSRFGHEIGGISGPCGRRREPAAHVLTRQIVINSNALGNCFALGGLIHVPVIARVIKAMTHHIPTALGAGLEDLGVMQPVGEVQRQGDRNLQSIGHFGNAPQPDSVAIITQPVAQNIGLRRAGPRVTRLAPRRHIFVMLDVGHDPDSHTRTIRQAQSWPVCDGLIFYPVLDHASLRTDGQGWLR